MNSHNNSLTLAVIGVLAVIYLAWKIIFPPTWIGFFYPDQNNLFDHKQSYELKSLEECRDWIDEMSSIYDPNNTGMYDYECGKNCKLSDSGVGIYVCDETKE